MSARELPPGLPPLPYGAVYLPDPDKGIRFDGWSYWETREAWLPIHRIWGKTPGHYAALANSEIARLNGYGAPADTEKESEAVALVRKLVDSLEISMAGESSHHSDSAARKALAEAAAFLAKEAKK